MRLWHQSLIPLLPRQQLLGQHGADGLVGFDLFVVLKIDAAVLHIKLVGSHAKFAGAEELVGNNFTLSGNYNAPVYWSSNDAKIDLSEYTGESFKFESSGADMPLENIILPEGWKLYDTSDNEIVATVKWGTIIAKPADAQ